MPYEDLYQPAPDLVAAGGAAPTADSGQMIDALRSRGSLPGEALMALLQQGQPTAGQQMANAFTGGFAAMAGVPNPVQQQLNFQQTQGLAMGRTVLSAMAEQRRLEMEQRQIEHLNRTEQLAADKFREEQEQHRATRTDSLNRLFLEVTQKRLGETENPDERLGLAKQLNDIQVKMGMPAAPPETIQSWAIIKPNKEKSAMIAAAFDALGNDPNAAQMVAQRYGLTPAQAQYEQQLASKDSWRSALGLPTKAKTAKENADAETAQITAWTARNPQFKDTGTLKGVTTFAADFLARAHPGISLFDLDPARHDDANLMRQALDYGRRMAEGEQTREADTKFNEQKRLKIFEAGLNLGNQKALIDYKAENAPDKPVSQLEQDRIFKPLEQARSNFAMLGTMDASIKRLADKGMVPTNSTAWSAAMPALKRFWNSEDTDVRLFKQFVGEELVGQIARGLFNEVNVRSVQAFQEQLNMAGRFPSVDTFTKLKQTYETILREKADAQMSAIRKNQRLPGWVVNEAEDRYREIQRMQPKPPGPLTPPTSGLPAPTVPGPGAPAFTTPGKKGTLSMDEYRLLQQNGYDDNAIRDKGWELPSP